MTVKKWHSFEEDGAPPDDLGWGGFLRLTRRRVRNRYEDGSHSGWYSVESAHSPFKDAVVLCLYAGQSNGQEVKVMLRRSPRPAVALRPKDPVLNALDEVKQDGSIWELPAGGIETTDLEPGGGGIKGRACLEAWEEGGFKMPPQNLISLGPAPFSAPALCSERLHYFAARVDPDDALPPPGDGHPLEVGAETRFVFLDQALEWCRLGRIIDLKTEVGLGRLRAWLKNTLE